MTGGSRTNDGYPSRDALNKSSVTVQSDKNDKRGFRFCLKYRKYALPLEGHCSIRFHSTSERGITLNLCAKTANPCAGVLRDTVMSERGPTVVHCGAWLATDAPVSY